MTTCWRFRPAVLVLLLALAATGYGQWVEDSIDVGGAWVGSMAYNPLMDVVYGAGERSIFFAVDCAANRVIAAIQLRYAFQVVYDSVDHKVYCTYYNTVESDSILVVDGRTHQRIRSIPCDWASELVWDGMRDRLYVSCPERDVVAVFDCTQDSLICEIPVGRSPLKMFLNGRHRKLYVLNHDESSVSVIDLWTNRVLRTISLQSPHPPYSACYVPGVDKFYCDSHEDVTVIDGVTNAVIKRIPFHELSVAGAMTDVAGHGTVAVGVSDGLSYHAVLLVDAAADTVVAETRVVGWPERLWWSAASDRIYCASGDDWVTVLSGGSAELLDTLRVQWWPFQFAYSPRSRRLYVSHLGPSYVYVIRDEAGGVAEEPSGAGRPARVRATVTAGRLCVEAAGLLLDVGGRTVARLEKGENDVRRLAPGVYVVTTARGVSGRVVKVR
ncbi:MAG: YncE family protein [bacterium]